MKTDAWYPISLSGAVMAGTSNGTHLLGQEIVVWRDGKGAPHVWEDRCPHRGMRLSFGFVRSDRITCLYHGWQYGSDGHCLYIPAHPDLRVPPTITVWRQSCHEALGMIWARFGEAGGAPDLGEMAGRAVVPVRSIHIDCPPEALADRVARADFAPFDPRLSDVSASVKREGALVVVERSAGDRAETLIGGVQPLDDGHSALHLVMLAPKDYLGAGQAHFSAFAEALRNELESGPAARATAPAH